MSDGAHNKRSTDTPVRTRLKRLLRENWYRDIWLILISLLLVLSLLSDRGRTDKIEATQSAITDSRVENVRNLCERINRNTDGVNTALDFISTLVYSPATIDQQRAFQAFIDRAGVENFPPLKQRLQDAKDAAQGIKDNKLSKDNCEFEVQQLLIRQQQAAEQEEAKR